MDVNEARHTIQGYAYELTRALETLRKLEARAEAGDDFADEACHEALRTARAAFNGIAVLAEAAKLDD